MPPLLGILCLWKLLILALWTPLGFRRECCYTVFCSLLYYYLLQKTSPIWYFVFPSLIDTSHHCICMGPPVGKVLCRPQNPGLVPLNARHIMCLNSKTMINSRMVSLWDSSCLRMAMRMKPALKPGFSEGTCAEIRYKSQTSVPFSQNT